MDKNSYDCVLTFRDSISDNYDYMLCISLVIHLSIYYQLSSVLYKIINIIHTFNDLFIAYLLCILLYL